MQPVPDAVLALIRLREGWRTEVYRDTRGYPTAGVGHKLLPSERAKYPLGTTVPDDVLTQWEVRDTTGAYQAAIAQGALLGVTDENLINALASVSFQVGTNWYTEYKTLWGLLMQHRWNDAALDAEGTRWAKQTRVRVDDFTKVLRSLPDDKSVV